MNLVKWVDPRAMMNTFVEGRLLPSGNDAVPVIPLSALREVVEGLKYTTASLVAAVSILERGGKSVKRVVASDKMFDKMVTDYKKAVREARLLLASLGEVEK